MQEKFFLYDGNCLQCNIGFSLNEFCKCIVNYKIPENLSIIIQLLIFLILNLVCLKALIIKKRMKLTKPYKK